jgi:hypothetical protein
MHVIINKYDIFSTISKLTRDRDQDLDSRPSCCHALIFICEE